MYGFLIRIFFIVYFLLILSAKNSLADQISQLEDYIPVFDLSYSWQVYDDKYQAYIPYLNVRHKNIKSASFWLDTEKYRGYTLLMYVNNDTYLFINKKLCRELPEEGWVVLEIDSLSGLYPEKELFVTLYDKGYRLPLQSLYIGSKQKSSIGKEIAEEQEIIIEQQVNKVKNNTSDFFIVSFLLLVILFALLRNIYPKLFILYYGFRSNFSYTNSTSNLIFTNPITFKSLLFLSTHSLLIGFFYMMAQKSIMDIFPYNLNPLNNNYDFIGISTNYLVVSIFVFTLILIKYLLLFIFGIPLQLRGIVNSHFYEFIRLSNLFYVCCTLFIMSIYFSYPEFSENIRPSFIYAIVFFHIMQSIVLSFYINQEVQSKNLYLFYYLCITELTPLLIGVKFLLFN